jgi:predicted outer membrane repeat protein
VLLLLVVTGVVLPNGHWVHRSMLLILIACATAVTHAAATGSRTTTEDGLEQASAKWSSARRATEAYWLKQERLRLDTIQAEHFFKDPDASEPRLLGPAQNPRPGRALAVGANAIPSEVSEVSKVIAGCSAAVGPGEDCITIKLCLRAMSAECAVKTLILQPGVHSGSQNVNVGVARNESVALIGAGDAVIDGDGTDWLLSVVGNGSLALTNLTLQRAFLPADSPLVGAALSVNGQGVLNATGVQFLDNQAAASGARGGAVSLVDSAADPARWLDARFVGCIWEGNRVGTELDRADGLGGGSFALGVSASFDGCWWRNNFVGTRNNGGRGMGGGLFMNGHSTAEGAPQPSLADCVFELNNAGYSGGGMRVNFASTNFARCVWRNNNGGSGGGGLVLNGDNKADGAPQSNFTDCNFEYNAAGLAGGGMFVQFASPSFARCVWRHNTVFVYGAGLYMSTSSAADGVPQSIFADCTFEFNIGRYGGGMDVQHASPSFARCTWRNNTVGSGGSGGGLDMSLSSSSQSNFADCTFEFNVAGKFGGGMRVQGASPSFTRCAWHHNTVGEIGGCGGGLDIGISQSNFADCTFEYNIAGPFNIAVQYRVAFGGGTHVQSASPSFARCVWRHNNGAYGGGLELRGESAAEDSPQPNFADCTFEYNVAIYGGGTHVQFTSPSFARCVWRGNTGTGGGLLLSHLSAKTSAPPSSLLNCTFKLNKAVQEGSSIGFGGGGAVHAQAVPGLRFVGVVFLRNEAPAGPGHAAGLGGAVAVVAIANSQILVVFEHCRFDSNSAAKGGGAVSLTISPAVVAVAGSITNDTGAAAPPAVCTLLGTSFVDNRATAGAGGAVVAAFPPDTPANLHFLHNDCSGIVCGQPDDPSSNTPPDYVSNTARMWSRSVVLNLTDVAFKSNSAANNGGALAVTNGLVAMVNATMKANSARTYGGAVYLDGTASLSASETSWVSNIVGLLQMAASADGQHVYAASGGGEWNFSGNTTFEHENANENGLSAAKMDGAHGLAAETVICPGGAVVIPQEQWVSNYTEQSGEWRLGPGVTTTTTTGAVFNASVGGTCNGKPMNSHHYCPLLSSVRNHTNSGCEAEYFANFMCGNPPPVYPPMLYTTVSLGCKQCSRSEAALPAGEQRGGSAKISKCEPCPDAWIGNGSATCDSGHVVQQAGWWRPEAGGFVTTDTRFWACYTHEAACLGSRRNTTAGAPPFDAQCAPGHTGPVCALCQPGFAMVHSKCEQCPPGAWAAIGSAVALAVSCVGSVAVLYYNRKRLGVTKKVSSIKIVIGFYSLLAVVEQTFAIAWPVGFQRVLSNVKAAFASVLDLSSFACALHVDWFHKVGFWCLALIAVLVALAAAFQRAVSKFYVANAEEVDGIAAPPVQSNRKGKVAWLVTKLFGVERPPELEVEYCGKAFNVMLLVYPFLSPAAVAVFDCRKVAGIWYLEADYSLRCFDSRWVWWATVSAFVSVFYVIGLPCLALFSVIRRSPSIEFISAGYRTDGGRIILGWEVLEMLRKFLLTSAVIFWPKGSCVQVAVAVMVSMFFLAFQMYHMPYDTRIDNWFQVLALVGLLLVYFMGLLIKVQPDLESRYGFDAILQLVSMAVAAIVFAVPIIHKARLKWRARGRARARSVTMVELSETLLMNDADQGGDDSYIERLQAENHAMQEQLRIEQQKLRGAQQERQCEQGERQREQEQLRLALQRAESAEGERTAMQDQLRHVQNQLQRSSAISSTVGQAGGLGTTTARAAEN